MRCEKVKQSLDALPDMGCELEDIAHSMRDEAESMRRWINDCILRQHMKNLGHDRLSANTRKLIKAKSYVSYIDLSRQITRDMQHHLKALMAEIKTK